MSLVAHHHWLLIYQSWNFEYFEYILRNICYVFFYSSKPVSNWEKEFYRSKFPCLTNRKSIFSVKNSKFKLRHISKSTDGLDTKDKNGQNLLVHHYSKCGHTLSTVFRILSLSYFEVHGPHLGRLWVIIAIGVCKLCWSTFRE